MHAHIDQDMYILTCVSIGRAASDRLLLIYIFNTRPKVEPLSEPSGLLTSTVCRVAMMITAWNDAMMTATDDRLESSRASQFRRRRPDNIICHRSDVMSKDKYLYIYEYLIKFLP